MNKKQEYAPNGKPIVYELYGDDKLWHILFRVGIWVIIIMSFFALLIWGITGDWESLFFVFFGLFIGIPSIIAGKVKCSVVYRLTEEKKKSRKTTIIIVTVFFIIGIIYCMIDSAGGGGYSSSQRSSDYSTSSSSKDGFIGSDGEYHSYNPAYGDDVNQWMENNW